MPSIRGSSTYKPVGGITIYGPIGPTGFTGPTGADKYGPTGPTADKYLTGITLNSDFKLITTFLNGTTYGATGILYGITGDTTVLFDGRTAAAVSTGTVPVFVGATGSQRIINLRKIKGSTGFRSFVQVTADSQVLYLNVQRYDGEFTLSSGDRTQLVGTDGSLNYVGTTAAFYGEERDIIEINKINLFEKSRGGYYSGGSLEWVHSTNNITVYLHPYRSSGLLNNPVDRYSKPKFYAVDLNQLISSATVNFIIDSPPVDPIAFSLYVQGGNMPCNYSLPIFSCPVGSGGSVIFPFNRQPCFKSGQKYLIHFISANNKWYGYIFSGITGSDYFCDCGSFSALQTQQDILNSTESQFSSLNYILGLTGACCKNGLCEELPNFLCDGSFFGMGTTCGATGTGVCETTTGSCCIKNTTDGKNQIYCLDNLTPYQCLNFSNTSIEAIFNKNKICSEINCSTAFEDIGACCNGSGICSQQTEVRCIKNGGYFLGIGSKCYLTDSEPVCSSGYGACCGSTGTCSYSSISDCISQGGLFAGNGTTCDGITCGNFNSCCSYLNYRLKPGDLFGGGIIVGTYSPKTSKLLGAKHAFSRGTTLEFLQGGETLAGYYQSEFDYIGYGMTGDECLTALKNKNQDSYYIIAALKPIAINEKGKLVDQIQENFNTDTFPWYGNGIAWGPLLNLDYYFYDDFTFLDKTYAQYYSAYGEGYYGITGDNLDGIITTTLQTCYSSNSNGTDPIAKIFAKNIKGSNGLWNRNWGLYNTIRMISADNAEYFSVSQEPYFNSSEFSSGVTMTSVRALKLLSNDLYENSYGITANPQQLSDWYLPSHDELAFIAANCISDATNKYNGFNINAQLLANNGIPFDGWHWSSTGSFDETDKLEGIYVNSKPKHGSVAWAINFDVNGLTQNFTVKKEKRSTPLKVRPIRAIRCDSLTVNSSQQQYKLWKTPILGRDRQ